MGYMKEFKKRLKILITEENIKKAELAKKADIDKSAIYEYLNFDNTREPDVNTLINISKALNTSISYLTGETNVRDANDTAIGVRFNIDSMVIENLERIKKINEQFDNKYCDVLGEFLTDPDLYKDLIKGIDNTLQYSENNTFRNEVNNRVRLDKLGFDEMTRAQIIGSFFWNYNKYIEKKEIEYNISNLSEREKKMQIKRLRSAAYRLEKTLKD